MPTKLWKRIHNARAFVELLWYRRIYGKTIKRLKHKNEPLNVLFMAIYDSNWKYDSVYREMEKDVRFNPIVLVCPVVNRGREHMLETMEKCCSMFEKKGYHYIRTYNEKTGLFVDAHSYNPDIIFYTNPYKGLIHNRYYIDEFDDALTCYVNYGYINVHMEWAVNLPFHQKVWRYFVECEDNLNLVKQFSLIKARNVSVVGYPMFDAFTQGTTNGDNWKIKDKNLKRIIWSPHHTISNSCDAIRFSTFELFYDFMWHIAIKYENQVQIVFKPHPLLRQALYRLNGWGKERTDANYNKWAKGTNTAFIDGDYVDLFKSSDAIINDSGSFTIEYLYVRKPCLYLNNYDRQTDANTVTLQAFDCWYKAATEEEIENFVKNVVLGGEDPLEEKRHAFYKEVLLPPNGKTVAENIINEIIKGIYG